MKKVKTAAALLCSACLVLSGTAVPTMADSVKVVTLGADLTQDQKNTMMKYFNVSADQVQILTVTNQDEHNHLDNIAPQEQIGSHTLSCAYVKPTQSGGIKVRTANLNWVTGNMIATSLSTSGVKNCEVIAACPMEVSGTGALTGIQMAYEKASGEKLDATKTKLANQEIVTTGELADKVGKDQATTVVNQSKMDVIQNDVQNADEIQNIVINVANQNNISVSQDDIDKIVSLLQQIAQQGYNYDDVKQTLEQVDANTTGASTTSAAETGDSMDEENPDDTVDVDQSTEDDDDIMNNVNSDVLGDNVIESSTEENDQEEAPAEDSADSSETEIPDATEDGTYTEEDSTEDTAEGTSADETGIPEATEENTDSSEESSDQSETSGAEADASQIDTSVLSEENKTYYDKFELFVKGEYEGDADALLAATENTEAVATVTLDQQTAKSVAETVEKQYYDILKDGTGSYVADGTETYLTPELNMMDQNLKKLFGIEITEENSDTTDEAAALLADVTEEDKQTLYKETMKYLAGLYGENTDTSEEESAQ